MRVVYGYQLHHCFWTLQGFVPYYTMVGEGTGTHSSALAGKIPWMEKPGGLQSMGSLRVGHD